MGFFLYNNWTIGFLRADPRIIQSLKNLFAKYTLDQYVESDYMVVYFPYGLKTLSKTPLKWLQTDCKEFEYNIVLKVLYVVYPTNVIKILWNIFKPLISHKFGKKITYLNYLDDLGQHLKYDQLNIPQEGMHDENLWRKQKAKLPPVVKAPPPWPPLPTQQFGVSLQYPLLGDLISLGISTSLGVQRDPRTPFLVWFISNISLLMGLHCVASLGLLVEGLFRRSASTQNIKDVQKFNNGKSVNFDDYHDSIFL
ncbi:LOW QUALITY PROTEIN: rho GTPase-activating protein 8 [Ammospiza maritima maritima]